MGDQEITAAVSWYLDEVATPRNALDELMHQDQAGGDRSQQFARIYWETVATAGFQQLLSLFEERATGSISISSFSAQLRRAIDLHEHALLEMCHRWTLIPDNQDADTHDREWDFLNQWHILLGQFRQRVAPHLRAAESALARSRVRIKELARWARVPLTINAQAPDWDTLVATVVAYCGDVPALHLARENAETMSLGVDHLHQQLAGHTDANSATGLHEAWLALSEGVHEAAELATVQLLDVTETITKRDATLLGGRQQSTGSTAFLSALEGLTTAAVFVREYVHAVEGMRRNGPKLAIQLDDCISRLRECKFKPDEGRSSGFEGLSRELRRHVQTFSTKCDFLARHNRDPGLAAVLTKATATVDELNDLLADEWRDAEIGNLKLENAAICLGILDVELKIATPPSASGDGQGNLKRLRRAVDQLQACIARYLGVLQNVNEVGAPGSDPGQVHATSSTSSDVLDRLREWHRKSPVSLALPKVSLTVLSLNSQKEFQAFSDNLHARFGTLEAQLEQIMRSNAAVSSSMLDQAIRLTQELADTLLQAGFFESALDAARELMSANQDVALAESLDVARALERLGEVPNTLSAICQWLDESPLLSSPLNLGRRMSEWCSRCLSVQEDWKSTQVKARKRLLTDTWKANVELCRAAMESKEPRHMQYALLRKPFFVLVIASDGKNGMWRRSTEHGEITISGRTATLSRCPEDARKAIDHRLRTFCRLDEVLFVD